MMKVSAYFGPLPLQFWQSFLKEAKKTARLLIIRRDTINTSKRMHPVFANLPYDRSQWLLGASMGFLTCKLMLLFRS